VNCRPHGFESRKSAVSFGQTSSPKPENGLRMRITALMSRSCFSGSSSITWIFSTKSRYTSARSLGFEESMIRSFGGGGQGLLGVQRGGGPPTGSAALALLELAGRGCTFRVCGDPAADVSKIRQRMKLTILVSLPKHNATKTPLTISYSPSPCQHFIVGLYNRSL